MEHYFQEVETIVNALLQVSDRVVEVSKDHVITKIWDSNAANLGSKYQYIGMRVPDLSNESIVKQCDELVTRCFALRNNSSIQYTTTFNNIPTTFSIRILAIHPNKDFAFATIKNLTQKDGLEIVEDKWKLALDAAGDGMWDLNMQTDKIYFSPKWQDIFGYNSSDVPTLAVWSTKIHPDDFERYKHAAAEYLEGKSPSYSIEIRFRCKDGRYKWILSRGVVVSRAPDGKPLRAIGTHHDINDQKTAEQELKMSRDIFASAFNHSGIGIALIDVDTKWVDINEVLVRMTGYTKPELMKLTHYDVTLPEDREIDRGLINQMLRKEIETYTIEKRYLSKDKKVIVGLLNVSLVWNSDDTPKFFICQVIDITKKKEMENEIKAKNAELEQTKGSLVNKVRQLEELNNIIAKNLEAPAADIKTTAEAILGSHKSGTIPVKALNKTLTEDEAIELIRENSTILMNTINTIIKTPKNIFTNKSR